VVPVKVVISAMNGSTVVGSTVVSGSLGDTTTTTPWSYTPQSGGAIQPAAWYPAVDPNTGQPVTGCRFGKESLPSNHCYQQASCPKGFVAVRNQKSGLTVTKALCAQVAQPTQKD
jgi:hypothetical protein